MPENGAAVKINNMWYTKYFIIPYAQIYLNKVKEVAVTYGTIHEPYQYRKIETSENLSRLFRIDDDVSLIATWIQ
jgi:hypothetical protein